METHFDLWRRLSQRWSRWDQSPFTGWRAQRQAEQRPARQPITRRPRSKARAKMERASRRINR